MLEFIHQMTGSSNYGPEYACLTSDGKHVNMFLRVKYCMNDYFLADTASSSLGGVFLFKEVVRNMMNYVSVNKVLTRYPLLSLMFKLDNDYVDSRGVGFLMNDAEPINADFNNNLDHPFYPR